jgi:putative lipoprotein
MPGQPPFQFSIRYDPEKILENRSYFVRARIAVDANPMFTTDQAYPVLTQGKGRHIALIIMRRAGTSRGGGTLAESTSIFIIFGYAARK